MTELEYKRWQSFALRMAYRGFPRIHRKTKKIIARLIKDFFRDLKDIESIRHGMIGAIRGWEESDIDFYPSDLFESWEESWNPYYSYDLDYAAPTRQYHDWNARYFRRAACCLRAGVDAAVEFSRGVWGFQVRDLRRMYRGNIPEWLKEGWIDSNGQRVDLNQADGNTGIWL